MSKRTLRKFWFAFAALAVSSAPASASIITDAPNDYLGTYVGPAGPDLDVLSLRVDLVGSNFRVTATQAGPVGAAGTPGGFYVFGINRGSGTAGFGASLGLDKVLFDSVIIVRNNGTGVSVVGGPPQALAASAFQLAGNTVRLTIPTALLPSTGFTFDRYGWNLWPRSPGAGVTFISDFAPNNATVAAVPEPAAWGLMLAGFGLAGAAIRRRKLRLVSA